MRLVMPRISGISEETTMMVLPCLAMLDDELVDLVLGADVDAARGLVHEEDLRPALEPLAEDDLLLVAAGEATR